MNKKKIVANWGITLSALTIIAILVVGLFVRFDNDNNDHTDGNNGIDLAQCQVDAVTDYMIEQGFAEGDFVIGAENLDPSHESLTQQGEYAFGDPILGREDLASSFASQDARAIAARERLSNRFPDQNASGELFDPQNWEFIQVLTPSIYQGNTGFKDGVVVDMGDRINDTGDGYWLFIDSSLCEVARDADGNAGIIRVGCANGGDNIIPPCITDCPKDWSQSVTAPDGVVPLPAGPIEDRPELPVTPAPVISPTETPSSDSQAEGATPPDPERTIPPPATGTTSDGAPGSINPETGSNEGDAENPFD